MNRVSVRERTQNHPFSMVYEPFIVKSVLTSGLISNAFYIPDGIVEGTKWK